MTPEQREVRQAMMALMGSAVKDESQEAWVGVVERANQASKLASEGSKSTGGEVAPTSPQRLAAKATMESKAAAVKQGAPPVKSQVTPEQQALLRPLLPATPAAPVGDAAKTFFDKPGSMKDWVTPEGRESVPYVAPPVKPGRLQETVTAGLGFGKDLAKTHAQIGNPFPKVAAAGSALKGAASAVGDAANSYIGGVKGAAQSAADFAKTGGGTIGDVARHHLKTGNPFGYEPVQDAMTAAGDFAKTGGGVLGDVARTHVAAGNPFSKVAWINEEIRKLLAERAAAGGE